MSFINDMGYLRSFVPQDEADQKRLKRFIDTQLLMEAHSRDERKVIFVKFLKLLVSLSSICLLMTCFI